MGEKWLVFRDRDTGRELLAYTIRGTFEGEREATIGLLAAEEDIAPERITTEIEDRRAEHGRYFRSVAGSVTRQPHGNE